MNLKSGIKVAAISKGGYVYQQTSMEKGFVITKIDNESIDDVDNLVQYLNKKEGKILIEGKYEKDTKAYLYWIDAE